MEVVARSFSNTPLLISLIAEVDVIKQPPALLTNSYERRLQHFESGSILPSTIKGGLIAEADNWTAASLWEPPGINGALAAPRHQNPGPVHKEYIDKTSAARKKHLDPKFHENHWHLDFLARDSAKNGKGAVSAVMRPFLERAREDEVPAWLEAVAFHAVEVYEHYGFRICEKMTIGEGFSRADGWPEENGEGFTVWAMVYDEHLQNKQHAMAN